MKRRNFLKTSGAFSLPILLNGMPVSAVARNNWLSELGAQTDRVLVLIQLNGGNDGLNTLIPIDQYDQLVKARSNVLIPKNQILPLTETLGFHPSMEGFQQLFQDGKVGVVQDVGYPNQNRSHFRSTDIWQTASPATEYYPTGWLGRYFDQEAPGYPQGYPNSEQPDPFAITMGSTVSETCQGRIANFSMVVEDPFALVPLEESGGQSADDSPYGMELAFLQQSISQTNAYSNVVLEAAEAGQNTVAYPQNNPLAAQLRNVALLISGGLQTSVYVARLGGFDTHANQVVDGEATTGEHALLLQYLSEAITAFQEDLRRQGLEERVMGMTFSEFGRQIRSNFSLGTDHGTAAPLFLFGSCLKPGVLGANPDIPDNVEPQEGVPMQFDFRDVYGSVLIDWFNATEQQVKGLLHEGFQYLAIVGNCAVTATDEPEAEALTFQVYPNPVRYYFTIAYDSPGGMQQLSLFDSRGSRVRVFFEQKLPKGLIQQTYTVDKLPSGVYYLRLQNGARVATKRLVVHQ